MGSISILAYVSGHGFGHATRSAAVLAALARRRPWLKVHLRTTAPAHLFAALGDALVHGSVSLDVGTVQGDPFHLDKDATLAGLAALRDRSDNLVTREVTYGRSVGARLCYLDIPPLACRVGAGLGIPTVAMGNFSWDWIYEEFLPSHPAFAEHIDRIREDYSRADVLLRLPLSPEMAAFPRQRSIPLVARVSDRPREEVLDRLGLRGERRRIVLVSLGGFDPDRMECLDVGPGDGYVFLSFLRFTRAPGPHLIELPKQSPIPHPDLLAASDVVMGKLGYSTVAECIAQGRGLIYADREDFREFPVLESGVKAAIPHRRISRQELLSGCWKETLDGYFRDHPGPPVLEGGAVPRSATCRQAEPGATGRLATLPGPPGPGAPGADAAALELDRLLGP